MNGMLSLFAIVFSLVALLVALAALSMVIGQRLSTHKIEWKPLDFEPYDGQKSSDKESEDDDGKILEEALNLQRKGKRTKDIDPLSEVLETNNF